MSKIESVVSSNLSKVWYLPVHQILDIMFHSGEIYRYFNVPQSAYSQLYYAQSKGSYYNANIRNNTKYRGLKMSDPANMGELFLRDFKYVVLDNNGLIRDQRSTELHAEDTAANLAKANPGDGFYVMKIVGKALVPKPNPVYNRI